MDRNERPFKIGAESFVFLLAGIDIQKYLSNEIYRVTESTDQYSDYFGKSLHLYIEVGG